MGKVCVLDWHGEHCLTVSDEQAAEWSSKGLAVPYSNRRGPKKGVVKLTVSLAALSGRDPQRPLERGWMSRNRFVEKKMVDSGNGRRPVFHPVAPGRL